MGWGGAHQPSRVRCGVCGETYIPYTTSRHAGNRIHIAAARARGMDPATLDPQPLTCPACGGHAGWKGHGSTARHQAAVGASR